MLNDYQILVVRRALAQAKDKDAEIKRLAKGMQVKESEIRIVLEKMPQGKPAVSTSPEPSGRLVWTTKQLEQLHRLRAEGKGPAEIARIMGLKTHQVQSRLHSEKKSRSAAKSSAPVEAEPVPAGDDPPAAPPGPLAESEPAVSEPELPDMPEPPAEAEPPKLPVNLSDAMHSLREALPKIFPAFPLDLTSVDESDLGELECPIDMPAALILMMRFVHKNYGNQVIRVRASNDENFASCAFQVEEVRYNLTLEVLE